MIDAVSLLPSQVNRSVGSAEEADTAELFAQVLASEVRKSLPEEALGGEWSDVFGPLLDEVLAEQLVDDLRATLPGQGGDVRPTPGPSRWRSTHHSGHDHDDVRVTSGFGMRVHPLTGRRTHHDGVDVAAPKGTPIPVGRGGVVVRAERAGGYGNLVVVDHGDGVMTRYAHCDRLDVEAGQTVGAGDVLGTVGSTGRSTGPHLHFEVRVEGRATDPGEAGFADLFPQLPQG